MRKGELGEHSRKSRSGEGDADRPFKKARYVWQLKGKYHLKENSSKPNITNYSESIETITNNSDTDSETECTVNNNNTIRNNNNRCTERCCIDDLLIQSNALLEKEDSDQELSSNIEKSISDEIPVTLVKPNIKNQDEYLYKWQARQVAKSFVDNTINSILEHWKIAPFDAADFVENCENGEQVEDEGILMAIQSHGLQSNIHFSNSNQGEASRYQSSGELPERPEEADNNEEDDPVAMEDPMDFLNAAVSVAIQKKGLSSYNYG